MKVIDESQLEEDPVYRYQYLAEFIGFGDEDVAAIRSVIGQFAPKIPQIVDTTYEKMLQYDATARHFLPRQHGFEGEPAKSLADLDMNDPQIKFRKEHLQRYLMNLMGHSYNDKLAKYLNITGKIHTPKTGSKLIDVPLVQMNALMGLLSDILYQTIHEFGLEAEKEFQVQRAFQKLLWIQNDFINRHY
ncbi:MAG: protoglobin family protein [Planctomycetaceae bacterium]|nr:protoglobin family protein [Planctomycetaceae bacterium]